MIHSVLAKNACCQPQELSTAQRKGGVMGQQKPAHEIKLGRIRATIWQNETEDHELWFNVTLTRIYKCGTTWKGSSTFRRDDLPLALKALEMAYDWLWETQMPIQNAVERKKAADAGS